MRRSTLGSSRASLLLAAGLVPTVWASGLRAQTPADLGVREKTEIFIQHIVKIAGLEPSRYRSLVLEYEIGTALEELLHAPHGGDEAAGHEEHEKGCVGCSAISIGDFLERALAELQPSYGRLRELLDSGSLDEARALAVELRGNADPYVAAHAALALAEIDFRKASAAPGTSDDEALQGVIRACEDLAAKQRLYLVRDYRACQLIALCFERLRQPLFELLQYAILTVDYNDVPAEVSAAVKARLEALAREVNWPIGTVADWMNEVEKLLARDVTSKDPTQRQETQVVFALDKLIELQDARERKTCSSCGSSGCKGGCRSGRPSGSRSSNPAQVSALAQAKGEFLLRASSGDTSTIWGQLRAKEASRAMQAFKGKLPARYEQLLEKYYENLSKME